jgi:hypothetical protein
MSTVGNWRGPNIVKNGLVLYLDAGSPNSYINGISGTSWKDISGNANNGTLTNGPTFNSGNGGSIVFDGTNDYIEASSNQFKFNDSDVTFDIWCKINTDPNTYQNLLNSVNTLQSNGIILSKLRSGFGNGGIYFGLYVGGSGNYITGTLTGTQLIAQPAVNYTGVLQKVNGFYTLYLYGNGSLNSSFTTARTTYDFSGVSNYFTRLSNSTEVLNGNIFSAKIYNRALSAAEISQNFNATRARFGI